MAKKFLDLDGLEEVVAQVKSLLLNKQDTLSSANAGDNITIETVNNVLKISAMKGIEEITAQTINLDELNDGIYEVKNNATLSSTQIPAKTLVLKTHTGDHNITHYAALFTPTGILYYASLNENIGIVRVYQTDIGTIDNLTSTSTTAPLSANQGKVLKDLIDDATQDITNETNEFSVTKESDESGEMLTSSLRITPDAAYITYEEENGVAGWQISGELANEHYPELSISVDGVAETDGETGDTYGGASLTLTPDGLSYWDYTDEDGEKFLINGNPVATRDWTNTQLSGKQATITGAASTITTSDLTTNRALVSDSSGKVAVSVVTDTELGYLDGVTSAIQTQIDNKVAKTSTAKQLYGTDNASTPAQTTLTYGTTATVDYIVQRTAGGQITVPATPSADTDAASKGFVNSTVGTNTANFIGTFENIPALNAYSGTVTNNDYAYVVNSVITDNGNDWASLTALNNYNKALCTNFDYAWVTNGAKFDLYRFDVVEQTWSLRVQNTAKADVTLNTAYNRYKATVASSTVTWEYEFTLNNSSFTNAQWQAINSGITSTLVTQIGTNQSDISTLNGQVANKRDKITTASKIYSTDGSGNQSSLDYGTAATANYVVQRRANGSGETGGNGQITVPSTPVANTDAASKTYVDTGLSGKVAQVATASQVYITNSGGTSTTASQGTAFNKNFETSTTNIKMNGIVSVGSSTNIARADHVHPTDTTRQATYTASSSAWDITPTASSTKPVTSGGIYTALASKEDTMTAITTQEIDDLFNPTITFTIAGVSYTASQGMTWAEWIASAYNTGGFTCAISDSMVLSSSNRPVKYNDSTVQSSDTVVASRSYIISSESAGGGYW